MLASLANRLMARTKVTDSGCHEWQGYRTKNGYGQIGTRRRLIYTHRAAWMVTHGDPGDLYVLHKCDNRCCVNVDHLFLGSFEDNMADMLSKNRQAFGERSGRAKLTEPQAREIKYSRERTSVLARRFNVSAPAICEIRNGHNWPHL